MWQYLKLYLLFIICNFFKYWIKYFVCTPGFYFSNNFQSCWIVRSSEQMWGFTEKPPSLVIIAGYLLIASNCCSTKNEVNEVKSSVGSVEASSPLLWLRIFWVQQPGICVTAAGNLVISQLGRDFLIYLLSSHYTLSLPPSLLVPGSQPACSVNWARDDQRISLLIFPATLSPAYFPPSLSSLLSETSQAARAAVTESFNAPHPFFRLSRLSRLSRLIGKGNILSSVSISVKLLLCSRGILQFAKYSSNFEIWWVYQSL